MKERAIAIVTAVIVAVAIGSAVYILRINNIELANNDTSESNDTNSNGSAITNFTYTGQPLNIIVILTDDQRYDTVKYMPEVTKWIADHGMTFSNTYANDPQCCPARSEFISGGLYSYETRVLNNAFPNGGFNSFNDTDTLPVRLQKNDYTTGMIGKYLNEYPGGYVPPGWDYAVIHEAPSNDVRGFYNFPVTIGSSSYNASTIGTRSTINDGTYVTDYLTDKAIDFINSHANDKMFLYLTYNAPHPPSIPDPKDDHSFDDFVFASPAITEADLSDKPQYIQENHATYNPKQQEKVISFYRDQIESLQSVDRGVGRIMETLDKLGLLNNTMVVFASDNGYEWGEHGGLRSKVKEYEESIKVPMVIREPSTAGLGARINNETVTWTQDLPRTIASFARTNLNYSRGTDLSAIMLGKPHTQKTEVIFQAYGKDADAFLPIYAGIRSGDWKYVELATGEKELYNLVSDPYELQNLQSDTRYNSLMSSFSAKIDEHRGLTILTDSLPNAKRGVSYSATLSKWGGIAPFEWSMYNSSSLPTGLKLDADNGVIIGTPEAAGAYDFQIEVEDGSILPLTGANQRYVVELSLIVN